MQDGYHHHLISFSDEVPGYGGNDPSEIQNRTGMSDNFLTQEQEDEDPLSNLIDCKRADEYCYFFDMDLDS
ncbi:hypothetical protein Sjap_006301 [Stephania japonica]|uniref:Uncharacterized protein n=1 Tax=Stephania japonica TaxID=461633 RepID=A0AAP0K5K4_9MAGN